MAIDRIRGSGVLDGTIGTDDIANDAVTTAKLGNVTDIASSSAAMTLSPAGTEILNVGTTGDVLVKGQGNNRAALVLRAGSNTANSQLQLGDQASDFVGRIMYDHSDDTMRFQTNGSERVRISASGIHIGGTGAANALDDYEEGTWTPALEFGTGGTTGITYGTQSATYTKIGRAVHIIWRMYLTNKGSSSGHAAVTGLPFTPAGVPVGGVFLYISNRGNVNASDEHLYGYLSDGSSKFLIYSGDNDGTGNSAQNNGAFANNTELEASMTYFTS